MNCLPYQTVKDRLIDTEGGPPLPIMAAHLKAAHKKVHPIGPPKTPEKYLRGNMAGRLLVLTPFLFMLTSCQQEQLSLPVTHAASTQEARSEIQRPPADAVDY